MSFAKARDLLRLAILSTGRRGVSLLEIEESFECSHRTAQRMTQALEDVFPQTVRDCDEQGRARWTLPARSIASLLTPTAEELAALTTAITQLGDEVMTAEARALRSLASKVRALVPAAQGARLEVDEEALLMALRHAARPGPRPAADPVVDAAIYEALKGPLLLRIVYRKRAEDEPGVRIVEPHGLLLGVRRYLVARDRAKGAGAPLQHFRVEAIAEAEVQNESFVLDPGFDIGLHAQRGFGSYENQDEHGEVVWRFSPHAAPQARSFIFHPTQSQEDEPDGSLIVRFMASGHLEMCWHLYTWGDHVEVVAPEVLRRMTHAFRRAFPARP